MYFYFPKLHGNVSLYLGYPSVLLSNGHKMLVYFLFRQFSKRKISSNIKYTREKITTKADVNILIIRQHNSKYKLIYKRYFYFIFIERFTKDNNSIFCYFPFKYGKSCSNWSNAAVPKTNPYFFFLA